MRLDGVQKPGSFHDFTKIDQHSAKIHDLPVRPKYAVIQLHPKHFAYTWICTFVDDSLKVGIAHCLQSERS